MKIAMITALFLSLATVAGAQQSVRPFNYNPVPLIRNTSTTIVQTVTPTWSSLQGVPATIQSLATVTPTAGQVLVGTGSGLTVTSTVSLGIKLPVATSGQAPYACTTSTKGQKYMTAAGAECTCDGAVWRNNFSVNLISGLLNTCSW